MVERTTDQAAYLLQTAALSRLDGVVDGALNESDEAGEEVAASVRQAAREHLKWWLAPAFMRHDVDGHIRCQSCCIELSQLNYAEIASVVEECRMCRGWFTPEQRHEQHRQRQREMLGRVASR